MQRLLPFLVLFAIGCGKDRPMAKIEGLRDGLASSDDAALRAMADLPKCNDQEVAKLRDPGEGAYDVPCLDAIATALGSKAGFVANPPDHAGAATAAVVIARDRRGDGLAHVDRWLADLKSAKGTGHDALRLAVARRMADAAPIVGRKLEDDTSMRAALKAIVGAVPGACPTYWLVASSADAKLPPELSPDHSACVQRDLKRREGPGGSYGAGLARALEGGLAIWRETERALRLGVAEAAPGAKSVLEAKLTVIEPATQKIATVRVDSPSSATMSALAETHAEAGAPFSPPPRPDAGAPTLRRAP